MLDWIAFIVCIVSFIIIIFTCWVFKYYYEPIGWYELTDLKQMIKDSRKMRPKIKSLLHNKTYITKADYVKIKRVYEVHTHIMFLENIDCNQE